MRKKGALDRSGKLVSQSTSGRATVNNEYVNDASLDCINEQLCALALWNTPSLPASHRPPVKKYFDAVCLAFALWVKIPLFGHLHLEKVSTWLKSTFTVFVISYGSHSWKLSATMLPY